SVRMLDGIGEIDWARYTGAYGPATEAPDILRAMASPDPETAREGRFEFSSSIWHQGTVYPVTVVVVPFLVELAITPGVQRRDHLLHMLGDLCDPDRSYGSDQPAVREAISADSDVLLPQLADPDAQVRECAAYAVAWCGPHTREALLARWSIEDDPRVRSSLLLGLALHGPAESVARLRTAATSEPVPVPVAAALALARAGLRFPPDVIAPIAKAFAATGTWESPWAHGDESAEVLDRVDGATANALVAAMTSNGGPDVDPAPKAARRGATPAARIRAAEAMTERLHSTRSAPVQLMPHLRVLLNDTDPAVQAAAVRTVAHAGTPAAAVADELVRIAAGDKSDHRAPANIAMKILVRLGDPRWHQPMLAEWAAGRDPAPASLFSEYVPEFDPDLLTGARRRLAAQIEQGVSGNPVIALAVLLRGWGSAAAAAVPELIKALPAAPWAVPSTLAEIGAAALPAVPALRTAAEAGQVRAAHALLRLTGDPAPLAAAGAALLGTGQSGIAWDLDLVADAGPATAALLPVARERLTGSAGRTFPGREDQIAAARMVWRATGNASDVLPTVEAVLHAGDVPVRAATKLVAEMTPTAGMELAPALHVALDNPYGTINAARALWRLGTNVDELVPPLLVAAANPMGDKGATALLVEMRAVASIDGLTELVNRDERVVIHAIHDETVWIDDRIRREQHEAIATLRGRRS
ncbi:MAG: hypothetical protein J2P15_01745, partial [Micromonosporaceae bacterium]|nr:hypothetical protein [Micromonosporaceae bacterium]